jgi:hypothetical protein
MCPKSRLVDSGASVTRLHSSSRQIAYQNRHEAKSWQLKEVFRQCSTGAVEEVESVEKADAQQPEYAKNKWQPKANRLRKV